MAHATLDTSVFAFNSSFDDDSLSIMVNTAGLFTAVTMRGNSYYPDAYSLGQFNFSRCGSNPFPSVNQVGQEGWSQFQLMLVIPPGTQNLYNGIHSSFGSANLTLAVGDAQIPDPFSSSASQIEVLANAPDFYLVFPQQFFDAFGLLVPLPYTDQPFFFQDSAGLLRHANLSQ